MENVLTKFDNYKRTWSVKAELPVEFTLKYSSDVFDVNNHDLLSFNESSRRVVVIDETVYELYGQQLESYFKTLRTQLELFVIDATEENKDWEHTNQILKFFEDVGVLRREPIIVIGGGVLLDLVGFCCSIYRRGIPYVKVPTTLLAIVDASVGVKVAANHFERRNRIGAYYPPIATLIDKKFIKTQDERNIVNLNGNDNINDIFVVGEHYNQSSLKSGYLYLGIYDGNYADNAGNYCACVNGCPTPTPTPTATARTRSNCWPPSSRSRAGAIPSPFRIAVDLSCAATADSRPHCSSAAKWCRWTNRTMAVKPRNSPTCWPTTAWPNSRSLMRPNSSDC